MAKYLIHDVPMVKADYDVLTWAALVADSKKYPLLSTHLKMLAEAFKSAPTREVDDRES